MFRLAALATIGSASALTLTTKKTKNCIRQPKFGDQDGVYDQTDGAESKADRNAMFDCSGDGKVRINASNDMSMRVLQAKVSAVAGGVDGETSSADLKKASGKVQKFRRHAGQDTNPGGIGTQGPYGNGPKNYHEIVEVARGQSAEALKSVVATKKEFLGDQFAE